MPSFNPKTKKMNYSAADLRLLNDATELVDMIQDYDDEAKSLAKACRPTLQSVAQYIAKTRDTKPKPTSPPNPAA